MCPILKVFAMHTYHLGCDIGGTFTDFYLLDVVTGEAWQEKQLTTPDNPVDGVMFGLERLEKKVGSFLPETARFVHGTTLVINAVIERKGSKTGLITTRGFRDILEMRREERYDHYDLSPKLPQPLVARYLRRGISERTDAAGTILEKVDIEELNTILTEMIAAGVESVAVSLLHSYANRHNEEVICDVIKKRFPTLYVSLSSEVVPKINEYKRTTTTVVNAYAKPKIDRYLTELLERVSSRGYQRDIDIMLSAGGIIDLETAKSFPVRVIESGPVGGVIASEYYGEAKRRANLISFDMGGTTAKICLIREAKGGRISEVEIDRVDRFKRGSGIPLEVPFVDIAEIGAGGGSIAFINKFGLLEVGPESAGAKPGPACYGLGGDRPTVTDADLILGYLDKGYFLGGEMAIYPNMAEESVGKHVATPLEMSTLEAACGVYDIVNENMANTARIHAIEKGYNVTDFTLIAYGGAGPVHAYGVARKLKTPEILIPISAGVESAFGFLVAPPSFSLARTYKKVLDEADFQEVESIFKEMEDAAFQILRAATRENVQFQRSMDMCYLGQAYEISVDISNSSSGNLDNGTLLGVFEQTYRGLYGQTYPDVEVAIVNVKVEATVEVDRVSLPRKANNTHSTEEAIKGVRQAYCIDQGRIIDFTVYDRYRLPSGADFSGPAIIEERESTTVAGSQSSVSIDEYGIITISLQ